MLAIGQSASLDGEHFEGTLLQERVTSAARPLPLTNRFSACCSLSAFSILATSPITLWYWADSSTLR